MKQHSISKISIFNSLSNKNPQIDLSRARPWLESNFKILVLCFTEHEAIFYYLEQKSYLLFL